MDGVLLDTMKILKNGREKLIGDVVHHKRDDIYRWLFRHRKNYYGQRLVFDKYLTEWINSQLSEAFSVSKELGCRIAKYLSPIIDERAAEEKQIDDIAETIPQLLNEKVNFLKSLMNVDDINETRINHIKFKMEQDNALFDRYLEELSEKKEGNS